MLPYAHTYALINTATHKYYTHPPTLSLFPSTSPPPLSVPLPLPFPSLSPPPPPPSPSLFLTIIETRTGQLGHVLSRLSRSDPVYKISGYDPDSALDYVHQ